MIEDPEGLCKRKGKRLGEPPVDDQLLERTKTLGAEGLSYREVGRRLGVDERTIRKRLRKGKE